MPRKLPDAQVIQTMRFCLDFDREMRVRQAEQVAPADYTPMLSVMCISRDQITKCRSCQWRLDSRYGPLTAYAVPTAGGPGKVVCEFLHPEQATELTTDPQWVHPFVHPVTNERALWMIFRRFLEIE